MTNERAIKLLRNEIACVETDACDHECYDCLLAGNQREIIEALNMAIDALKNKQPEILQSGLQSAT